MPTPPDATPLWDQKARCLRVPMRRGNEINGLDARNLVKNGVCMVSEGTNMPTAPEGVDLFVEEGFSMDRARRPTQGALR